MELKLETCRVVCYHIDNYSHTALSSSLERYLPGCLPCGFTPSLGRIIRRYARQKIR